MPTILYFYTLHMMQFTMITVADLQNLKNLKYLSSNDSDRRKHKWTFISRMQALSIIIFISTEITFVTFN